MPQSLCQVVAATFRYVAKRGGRWLRREQPWNNVAKTWSNVTKGELEIFVLDMLKQIRWLFPTAYYNVATTWYNAVQRGCNIATTGQNVHRTHALRCATFMLRCGTLRYVAAAKHNEAQRDATWHNVMTARLE